MRQEIMNQVVRFRRHADREEVLLLCLADWVSKGGPINVRCHLRTMTRQYGMVRFNYVVEFPESGDFNVPLYLKIRKAVSFADAADGRLDLLIDRNFADFPEEKKMLEDFIRSAKIESLR